MKTDSIRELIMQNRLVQIIEEINSLKIKLTLLWESKCQTDQEVLELSEQIDELINEYNRLIRLQL